MAPKFILDFLGITELQEDVAGLGERISNLELPEDLKQAYQRVDIVWTAKGQTKPHVGNGKVETFGARVGKLAKLSFTYVFGDNSHSGEGPVYSWLPPADWQPNPFNAQFELGVGFIEAQRSTLKNRAVVARFHQENVGGRRFGVRLFVPTSFDPQGDSSGLVRPDYPVNGYKPGDVIRFSITYMLEN